MTLLLSKIAESCKKILPVITDCVNRTAITAIAFNTGFTKRLKKFEPWLFVCALFKSLSNTDKGFSLRRIHESSIKAPNSTHPHPTHDLQNFQTRTDF